MRSNGVEEENEGKKTRNSKREKIKKSKKRLELGKRIRMWDRRETKKKKKKSGRELKVKRKRGKLKIY